MNPMDMLKLAKLKSQFTNNHPKFPMFVRKITNEGIKPGNIIRISIENENGSETKSSILVKESDLEIIEALKNLNLK